MKRLGIILLVICALLAPVFTACSDSGTQKAAGGDGTEKSADTSVTEAADTKVYPDLPDKNFNGTEFDVVGFSVWGDSYFFAEEQNGDTVNDAIFERNSRIEEKYNIDINYTVYERGPNDVVSFVTKSVTAGDVSCDLAMTTCEGAAQLMVGGYLTNLYDVPYIDLTKPWWDADAKEDLSVGGKLYYTVNSLDILADNLTSVVYFNKQIINNLKLDSPYGLVNSDNWTWSKMYEMSKGASEDLNGDGAMNDLDKYGIITASGNMADGMMNCGEPITKKDSSDYPALAMNTDRTVTVAQTIYNMLIDKNNVLIVDNYKTKYADAWLDLMYPAFKEGRGLFIARAYTQYVIYFRDCEVDYGIVPRPKYGEDQERYYSDVNFAWVNTIAVPTVVKDPEMSGMIIEALSADSLYSVTPANYDIAIVNKQLRDKESEKMLKIVYLSRCFDYGQIISSIADLKKSLNSMLNGGSFTFTSVLAAQKEKANTNIQKFIDDCKKLG